MKVRGFRVCTWHPEWGEYAGRWFSTHSEAARYVRWAKRQLVPDTQLRYEIHEVETDVPEGWREES